MFWLVSGPGPQDSAADGEENLTRQQRQVYRLLCNGLSYKEVAATMGLAHSTVRVQVAMLRKRLGAEKVPVLRKVREARA